ncbi:hypothetical protein LCGC14_2514810, partial [marine sediment metagenome]
MPTDEQLKQKMAEVQGWTDLRIHTKQYFTGDFDHWLIGSPPNRKDTCRVPNWPTDRNLSKDLQIKDFRLYAVALDIITEELGISAFHLLERRYPANIECLAWILSEHGYRWVECEACKGGGEVSRFSETSELQTIENISSCPGCSGAGGE